MKTKSVTESASNYDGLEHMRTAELLRNINQEDKKVAEAVEQVIPTLTTFVELLSERFQAGGRLFYIGAGTSGRLGILDASEIPPTYGMPHDRVIGLIAGGDQAIRKAVERAEDNPQRAVEDLTAKELNELDTLVGIAASGTTPYVLGGIDYARSLGCLTAGLTNNPDTPLAQQAEWAFEVIVGPEFVTGSTRMKSGTAQKLVLNMISTALMIRIGRVKGNKMVNMQLNNNKLVRRGIRFLMEELQINAEAASDLLDEHGSVQAAMQAYEATS
ncbi:MAG: N-acetylmuramic acid 6-phosphate etherase [Bacteroidota bacterium]